MTTLLSTFKQFIHDAAARGDHIASLAIQHGLRWTRADLPLDVKKRQVRRCFWQAFELALEHPERFTYVEGYAFNGRPIPIHHAWCVDEKGLVVDPTWNVAPTAIYAGIPFKYEALLAAARNIKELEEVNEMGFLMGMVSIKIIVNPLNFLKPKDSYRWGDLLARNNNGRR